MNIQLLSTYFEETQFLTNLLDIFQRFWTFMFYSHWECLSFISIGSLFFLDHLIVDSEGWRVSAVIDRDVGGFLFFLHSPFCFPSLDFFHLVPQDLCPSPNTYKSYLLFYPGHSLLLPWHLPSLGIKEIH